jgi:integrase
MRPRPTRSRGYATGQYLPRCFYQGIRRGAVWLLRLRDMQSRQGLTHFRIQGKRSKIPFVPIHPMVLRLIREYLEAGKHGGAAGSESPDAPFFRPVVNNRTEKHLEPGSNIDDQADLVIGEHPIGIGAALIDEFVHINALLL